MVLSRFTRARSCRGARGTGWRRWRRSSRSRSRARRSPRTCTSARAPSASGPRPELERRHRPARARPHDPLPHAVRRARPRLRRGGARRPAADRPPRRLGRERVRGFFSEVCEAPGVPHADRPAAAPGGRLDLPARERLQQPPRRSEHRRRGRHGPRRNRSPQARGRALAPGLARLADGARRTGPASPTGVGHALERGVRRQTSSPCSSSTSTTSRRSTTASAMRPVTAPGRRGPAALAAPPRRATRRPARRRRVRGALEDIGRARTQAVVAARRILPRSPIRRHPRLRAIVVDASIGIALGRARRPGRRLVRNADVAMYRAKAREGSRWQSSSRRCRRVSTAGLEAELRRASTPGLRPRLPADRALQRGAIVGVEALCAGGTRSAASCRPIDFIPLAEETGLILPLGRWVLQRGVPRVRRWRELGQPRPRRSA